MQVQIEVDVIQSIDALYGKERLKRLDEDEKKIFYGMLSEWLIIVGIAAVQVTLEKHPELTVYDLMALRHRVDLN